MPRRKNEKRIITLESFFENILVCSDKKKRPYIETFYHEAENVSQEKLGTLFGILEVSDESEDSSYIVNYLISVIRKEYFSKPKRGAIESLEAALHTANLALSKLAEHGSVSWLGKLNALVAVIEKNNLHLSQAGINSALLLRNKTLTDISDDLAEETKPHPLKTFENVTSGRLEDNDKLILATEALFDIFSFEEIKKSAIHFSSEEFTQFIRTALSNEVPRAAVLIINMKEKEEIIESQPVKEISKINVFSQAAFSRPTATKTEEVEEEIEVLPKQKNGHLYIKESETTPTPPAASFDFFSSLQEKMKNFRPQPSFSTSKKYIPQINFQKIFSTLGAMLSSGFSALISGLKNAGLFSWRIIQAAFQKITVAYQERHREKISQESIADLQDELYAKEKFWKKIIPDFSKIKNLASHFTSKQKIYAAVSLIVIFIVPLFIIKIENAYEAKKELARIQSIVPPPPLPLADDKNVSRLENTTSILEEPNASFVLNLNGSFLAATGNKIFNLETKESFSVPAELEKIDLAVPMEDLNLVLLLNKTSKKIFSFSPTSKKFQPNNLELPANAEILSGETYLTYLYLVDKNNGQIYRYPRAEGGFGAKIDWKKDSTDVSGTSAMAINENVFLSDGKLIQKFFRGKKIDFSIEDTATEIQPQKLWTKRDNEKLYVLDSANSRIIKLDKDGRIISQYYQAEISQAISFAINEEKNVATFATPTAIKSFTLN